MKDLSKEHGFEISWAKAEIERHKSILSEYEILKSKLKPLTPIVENAFDTGDLYGRNDMAFSCGRIGRIEAESTYDKENYINNTIIE